MVVKSTILMVSGGIIMTLLGIVIADPLLKIFVGYDKELMELARRGFIIFSFHFLICGINIYGSSLFTSLGNGLISAIIAFLRTLLFQSASVLILPVWFDLDGIWFSVIVAEMLSLIVTVFFILYKRKEYQYF